VSLSADILPAKASRRAQRDNDTAKGPGNQGLRVMHTMTLMTIGLYNEPEGAWLPSVLY